MQRSAFTVGDVRSTALRPLNYTPEVDALRTSRGRSVPLGTLLRELGPAYGTVFTRIDCAPSHGIELMSQSDMFAAEPSGRVIRRDSMAKPDRHLVRRWQVLIAGAGTLGENELYGRCVIADGRLAGKYVGPDALALTFKDEGSDLSLFAYAFLASALGVRALRSASYGTKILRMRSDIVAELPIPLADDETVARVAGLIRETVEQRERYAAKLAEARKVIEDLPEMREAHAMCAERRRRAITWSGELPTIHAWNYASAGPALAYLHEKWRARLADVVRSIKPKSRFGRVQCEPPHGVDLVSQRDVFMMRRIPRRIVRPKGLSDSELFAEPSTVLMARDGQFSEGSLFGRAELAAAGLTRAAISEHLMQVVPETDWGPMLLAYLTTLVGQRLTRTTAIGTSIPTIREDLFLRLPFPDVSLGDRKRVSTAIEGSLVARRRADHAETEAIRIIEEEVLPRWLA